MTTAAIVETILEIAVKLIALLPESEQGVAAHTVGVRLAKRVALRQSAQARLDARKAEK